MIQENFKKWNRITVGDCLTFPVRQPAMIPSYSSMLSRDKRLPLDTWNTSGLQENVFGNQSSIFDSSRDHPKGIHSCARTGETGSVPQATGTGTFFTRDAEQSGDTIPMPTFSRRPSTMSSLILVEIPKIFHGWTAKTANIGAEIR